MTFEAGAVPGDTGSSPLAVTDSAHRFSVRSAPIHAWQHQLGVRTIAKVIVDGGNIRVGGDAEQHVTHAHEVGVIYPLRPHAVRGGHLEPPELCVRHRTTWLRGEGMIGDKR